MTKKYSPTQQSGLKAEIIACHFLQQQGLSLVTRNFYTTLGEIDLVMQNDYTLVFVEVRYRQTTQYANSLESVDRRKQQRLIRASTIYLKQYPTWKDCRFDVLGIQSTTTGLQIDWIKDAFQVA